MKFEVYCDESRPDLFSSKAPPAKYLLIGSLWIEARIREDLKGSIHELRDVHKIGGEFKWNKISPAKLPFYLALTNLAFAQEDRLRFRCIAVDHSKVNFARFHRSDEELGFYKFYYQLIKHWLRDSNEYAIFCDHKKNRVARLSELQRYLQHANISAEISRVQAIHSNQSVLMQLADVLTGAAAARLNEKLNNGSAKEKVILEIESQLKRRITPTFQTESRFNVFKIDLEGGW